MLRLLPLIFILVSSCRNNAENKAGHNDSENVVHDTLQQDSPRNQHTPSSDTVVHLIRPGEHNLTLHWISWDHPGKITITPADSGWYTAKGQQLGRNNDDYLRIEGRLKPLNKNELVFEGRVEHRTSTTNNGQPCIKEGTQIFKSTKNRKYWRMQNMINCEGGLLTDYIDIYI